MNTYPTNTFTPTHTHPTRPDLSVIEVTYHHPVEEDEDYLSAKVENLVADLGHDIVESFSSIPDSKTPLEVTHHFTRILALIEALEQEVASFIN